MINFAPIPQRQGIRSRQIYYPGEPSLGTDPVTPVGYLMPLVDTAGFGTAQGLTKTPVFKGVRNPSMTTLGNITADGANPYALETRIFPRILKDFFGALGYVRPRAGTSSLHRLFIPTSPDADMGSGQIQDEYRETPAVIVRNKGVRPGSISMAYANEGAARYDANFMGIGREVRTDLGGTVVSYPNMPFSYFNGYAKLAGSYLGGMTEFRFALDPSLSRQDAAFHNGEAAAIGYGEINLSGSFGLMMGMAGTAPENQLNFYDMAVNQDDVPLDIVWANKPLDLADFWFRMIVPASRFSRRGPRPGGAAGRIITQDWAVTDSQAADIAAENFNSIRGPYNLSGTNNILSVKLNGGAGVSVTLPTGAAVTHTAIVAAINAVVGISNLAVAEEFMGRIMIRSKLLGSTASVQIDGAVANSASAILGFDNIAMTGSDDTPVIFEFYNDITIDL